MNKSLHLSELKTMSTDRRSRKLNELAAAARQRPNGEVRLVDLKIQGFEQRFHLSSQEMQQKIARGELRETADVCEWLMLIELRSRLADAAR